MFPDLLTVFALLRRANKENRFLTVRSVILRFATTAVQKIPPLSWVNTYYFSWWSFISKRRNISPGWIGRGVHRNILPHSPMYAWLLVYGLFEGISGLTLIAFAILFEQSSQIACNHSGCRPLGSWQFLQRYALKLSMDIMRTIDSEMRVLWAEFLT